MKSTRRANPIVALFAILALIAFTLGSHSVQAAQSSVSYTAAPAVILSTNVAANATNSVVKYYTARAGQPLIFSLSVYGSNNAAGPVTAVMCRGMANGLLDTNNTFTLSANLNSTNVMTYMTNLASSPALIAPVFAVLRVINTNTFGVTNAAVRVTETVDP